MARETIYPSKVICPRTAKIIQRTRLFDAIDEARDEAKVIWVSAPGGSGKTTLISSYLEQRQVSHCWYQVDEDDRDLATFFHYLGLAGKRAAPGRKKSIPKLTPEYQQGIAAFTRHFIRDLTSRLKYNGLIVLDNFQLLSETGPIPALIPYIAEVLPDSVSLVIVSRHLPPALMHPLTVKRQLCVIDEKLIRFEEEEWVAAAVLFGVRQSKEKLLSLRGKLDGWIAGLILMPDSAGLIDDVNALGLGVNVLDSYIADQFLSSLDKKTSELLSRVCYMPYVTVQSAVAVSHIAQAKSLLAELARKNLFVLRQGSKGYTVHPLVKEYLKNRVERTFTTNQLRELRLATGKALMQDGECEAAADLFLELEEWTLLAVVILEHAESLFESGRTEPLQRYFNALPNAMARHEPWVGYWKARLSSYRNVFTALDQYERAYCDFLTMQDGKGAYMTWYAAVSVICSTLLGGERLVLWVKRYDELTERYPDPPGELQQSAIEAVLLHGYFFSGQDPKKREQLRRRLASTIGVMPESSLRLLLMSNYAIVAAASGINDEDDKLFARFEHSLNDLKDDPVLYLGASIYFSIGLWSFSDYSKQLQLQYRALEVAEKSGVSVFYSHIYTQIVVAALGLNQVDLAKKYIIKLRDSIPEGDLIYRLLYWTCLIIAATSTDEIEGVDEISERYLRELESTNIAPFIVHHKLIYIYFLCVRQRSEDAFALHDKMLGYCQGLAYQGQIARFYMIYAKLFFDYGDYDQSDDYLAKSFLAARKGEVITCCHWPPALLAWACQRALVLGVESGYVSKIVARHYKNLSVPRSNVRAWPWPFRIYTFGRFEVRSKEGVALFKQRGGKSFSLLRNLVISLDGSLTPSELKERLYMDVEYGKAMQSLDTQIHRLRKYFENEQVVGRDGDRIRLNLKYFWVDALEFESLTRREIATGNALEIATDLQNIYKGEYIPEDEGLDVVAQRERYRHMYLSTLFKCLDCLQHDSGDAVSICRNALALEPLSEPLYRRLISIYLSQGNRDMAEVTLGQCRMMMKRYLDADLSSETLIQFEAY